MSAFDARSTHFWNPLRAFPQPEPTSASHLPPHYPPDGKAFDDLRPSQKPHPLIPPWNPFDHTPQPQQHRHRRGFHDSCPHPHRPRSHHDQQAWQTYQHPRFEEPLRPPPEQVFPLFPFQWSFESANRFAGHNPVETRPVSPLAHIIGLDDNDEAEDYQPGYAETIPDEEEHRAQSQSTEEHNNIPQPQQSTAVHSTASKEEGSVPPPWETLNGSQPNDESFRRNVHSANDQYGAQLEFASRWKALTTREAEVHNREAALVEAENRLQNDLEELALREHELRRLQFELQMEQHRFREEQRSRRRYGRSRWHWQPDAWTEDMDWESECDHEDMRRADLDNEFISAFDGSWAVRREEAWLPRPDLDAEIVKRAFEEYNTHWDTLQRSNSISPIRFPTFSGNPSDLLAHTTHHISHEHFPLAPSFRKPDDVIRLNLYSFFLATFSIPMLDPRTTDLTYLGLKVADIEKVQKLRNYLLRKEFNRWHPDKFDRLLEDEGREVVSADGRFRMREREVAGCVDQANTTSILF